MESVLRGKPPSHIFKVNPLNNLSIIQKKKISLRAGDAGTQADSRIKESAFLDCFNGAVIDTSAAVYAQISVDDILVFALGNSFNGAVVNTSTTLDTRVIDDVCHDFTS